MQQTCPRCERIFEAPDFGPINDPDGRRVEVLAYYCGPHCFFKHWPAALQGQVCPCRVCQDAEAVRAEMDPACSCTKCETARELEAMDVAEGCGCMLLIAAVLSIVAWWLV